MNRRKNPRRAAILARNILQAIDSDTDDHECDNIYCTQVRSRNVIKRKRTPPSKGRSKKQTQPVLSVTKPIELDGDSDHPENISETVKDAYQKNVESKVNTFFKSSKLLSDEEEDDEAVVKDIHPKFIPSKDMYILSDSDDDMPSTSVLKSDIIIDTRNTTIESPKANNDELMEIVDKILDSEDTPVETNVKSDNWNEFKSKTEELLGSVKALVNTFNDDKPKEVPVAKEQPPSKPICPICLETLGGNNVSGATICGHIFCLDCIKAAVKATKSCPTCRKKITIKQVHQLYL